LEECEVATRASAYGRKRTRLLGNVRLSHVRRSMARAALQRRLSWRLGRLARRVEETPRVKTLTLAVPGWPGHAAGPPVAVRLTAPDGYHTERSYSVASPPEDANQLELAIEDRKSTRLNSSHGSI